MPTTRRIPLQEFRDQNWVAFSEFEAEFSKNFTSYSRGLPPRFYKSIRDGVSKSFGGSIEALAEAGLAPRFHLKVVLDTNIVVQDSLAVAAGKPSTTARILSSPFVSVIAPPQILEETERIIRTRAKKKKLPVEVALSHARSLLRTVRITDPAQEPFVRRARVEIGDHAPEDVMFLALAMESGADAIVSRDQVAFDHQAVTKRWELRKLVDAVVTFESGMLSVAVVGTGASALIKGLQTVVVAILSAIFETLRVVLRALAQLVEGVLEALSKVPAWGWLAVGAALVGLAIYASRHPEFRSEVTAGLATLSNAVANLSRALIQAGTTLLEAIYELLIWLWNLLLPATAATVVVSGVLFRRIKSLLDEAARLQGSVPSA